MNEQATKFNVATGLTDIRETRGWWYAIKPRGADSSFNYDVIVYRDGRKVGSNYADSKWGGRRAARKIRSNYFKRALMTPEVGPLR